MGFKQTKEAALCPHCGHDEFVVSQSEVKIIRLLGQDKPPYVKEEVLSSEGGGYDSVSCESCGADLNPNEWFNSMAPEEV